MTSLSCSRERSVSDRVNSSTGRGATRSIVSASTSSSSVDGELVGRQLVADEQRDDVPVEIVVGREPGVEHLVDERQVVAVDRVELGVPAEQGERVAHAAVVRRRRREQRAVADEQHPVARHGTADRHVDRARRPAASVAGVAAAVVGGLGGGGSVG